MSTTDRSPLLVEAGRLLTSAAAEPLEDAGVLIADGLVAELGDAAELADRHPDARRIGGPGSLLIPGLVNAHEHGEGVSTTQMGFADEPFEPWMVLMHALPSVDPYLTTRWKSLLMLRSGVTTHVHVHFPNKSGYGAGPEAYVDDLERSLQAHRESGLRTAFAPYWRDRATWVYDDDARFGDSLSAQDAGRLGAVSGDGPRIPNEVYVEAMREVHRRLAGEERISAQLSIAAPQWASDELVDLVASAADELWLPVHMHALESRRQHGWGELAHGGRELEHLAEHGLLTDRTTLAHAVYLRDSDIDLLADRGAMVAHNCSSNLRLACGIAPIRRLAARGVTVGLGSDDMTLGDDDDMLGEVRTAHVMQRVWDGPEPLLSAADLLGMCWEGGAAVAGLAGQVGRLEPGYAGDAVLLDLDGLRGVYCNPRLAVQDLLVARAGRGHVTDVIVGGDVLFADGRPVGVDVGALEAEVREAATAAARSADPGRLQLLRDLRPAMLAYPPAEG